MSYPLVRDLAAEGIPVRWTCGVLGHSTQAYYAWVAAPVSRRDLDDAYLTDALIDAHGDDPEFGYRFLADELARAGLSAGERRVWRLCSAQRLWSATVRKGRTGAGKSPGPAVHDDHVQRDSRRRPPGPGVGHRHPPSTPRPRGRCTAARSRTCSATGSSATPSTAG